MSGPLTVDQKAKEYEKKFDKNCHFEHVSSSEDAVSFLKGYGKAVGDAYADELGKSQMGLLIKCILLVIGLIVMITTELSASWGALGIVLAPLMVRDIVAIKACQEGVKETNSCKDLSVIKWMSEPEIVQFTNRVIDDCNSKITLPPQNRTYKNDSFTTDCH